nr:MAG TPA: hypothetical protein [Caudoviricetes sp.]
MQKLIKKHAFLISADTDKKECVGFRSTRPPT